MSLIKKGLFQSKAKFFLWMMAVRIETWELIYKERLKNEYVRGLKLSRNVGHQNALLAGLFTAKDASDCVDFD